MAKALLIVDIQRDYFPGGAFPLVQPEAAAEAAGRVLAAFRDKRLDVVHVQHVWDEPEATFMRPGTPGIEIHPLVSPRPTASRSCRRPSRTRFWARPCATS